MITFRDGHLSDIPLIQHMASLTWWPAYSAINSPEQIQYMLDTIYASITLHDVIKQGQQHFVFVLSNEIPKGFASYGQVNEMGAVKIYKLYVLPETQGQGLGKLLIEEIKRKLLAQSIHSLYLNVNRYNPAKTFYERQGFRIIREEDIPIGPYWMNDYVMQLDF